MSKHPVSVKTWVILSQTVLVVPSPKFHKQLEPIGVIDDVKLVVSGKQSSRLSPLNNIVGDGNTLILKDSITVGVSQLSLTETG